MKTKTKTRSDRRREATTTTTSSLSVARRRRRRTSTPMRALLATFSPSPLAPLAATPPPSRRRAAPRAVVALNSESRATSQIRHRSKGGAGPRNERDAHLTEPPVDAAPPKRVDTVETALSDGKHVLVALDRRGARMYRTTTKADGRKPTKLTPLVRYNASEHVDPFDGAPAMKEKTTKKSSSRGGGAPKRARGGERESSGSSSDVGGGGPLTEPTLRGVVAALRRVLFSNWSPYDRVRVVHAVP